MDWSQVGEVALAIVLGAWGYLQKRGKSKAEEAKEAAKKEGEKALKEAINKMAEEMEEISSAFERKVIAGGTGLGAAGMGDVRGGTKLAKEAAIARAKALAKAQYHDRVRKTEEAIKRGVKVIVEKTPTPTPVTKPTPPLIPPVPRPPSVPPTSK